MLKKNLSKKITSAVLAIFFLCVSVAPVCSASNSRKNWMNQRPTKGNNKWQTKETNIYDIDDFKYDHSNYYVRDNTSVTESNTYCRDDFEYDYSDNDGKVTSPEEDHEDQKWKKSALSSLGNSVGNTTGNSSNNGETEGNNISDDYDREKEEEEEWNERTPNGYMRVGDYLSTTEEENNNLNDNDDHIANAEESGTQNGNTAINNYGQNNLEPSQNASQRGNQGTVTPWHLIVFDDNNNE